MSENYEITYLVTRPQLAMAFSEWLLRYEEDPSSFEEGYGDDYGDVAANYLLKLLGVEE